MSRAYSAAGVSFDRARRSTQAVLKHVRAGGGFSGAFDASRLNAFTRPLLLSTTDGLGTKTELAQSVEELEGLGRDLVNHCVNDLLVHGGAPLFFSDFLGTDRLDAQRDEALIRGCADALRAVGAVLSGGELAEMPDIYRPNHWELSGTLVGVVEAREHIDGQLIQTGDAVLALPSTGLHTNGYTLARRLLGPEWRETLLQPHRCYWPEFTALKHAKQPTHGLVHVTGGGLIDNPPRVLGPTQTMLIDWSSWERAPLFHALQQAGGLDWEEMARVFNCGVGMLLIAPPSAARAICGLIGATPIGHIEERNDRAVRFVGQP